MIYQTGFRNYKWGSAWRDAPNAWGALIKGMTSISARLHAPYAPLSKPWERVNTALLIAGRDARAKCFFSKKIKHKINKQYLADVLQEFEQQLDDCLSILTAGGTLEDLKKKYPAVTNKQMNAWLNGEVEEHPLRVRHREICAIDCKN